MKIYGEKNIKRAIKVGEIEQNEFNDSKSPVGFIKEHGLLGEYISKMDGTEEYEVDTDPKNVSMESVEYNGETYWYGVNPCDRELTMKLWRRVGFYKELPDIYDDDMFHWKVNKKYGSKECTIEEGMFEYFCIYKPDGNATVDVKYVACDNRHRNKVTMSTIEIEYASNETILRGIREWKKSFKEVLKAV